MNREKSIDILCQLGICRYISAIIVDIAIRETKEFRINGIWTEFSESFDDFSIHDKHEILAALTR